MLVDSKWSQGNRLLEICVGSSLLFIVLIMFNSTPKLISLDTFLLSFKYSYSIFQVLYSLITFGVVMEHNLAEQSLDPPEHMLRLRLVCILLDTCGQYFTTGSSKKKLDYFLIYLQRYYWFKRSHPMYEDETKFPLGMTNLYLETISGLRPKLKMYDDFEEACLAVQKVENEFISVLKQKGYVSDLSTSSSKRYDNQF